MKRNYNKVIFNFFNGIFDKFLEKIFEEKRKKHYNEFNIVT